MITLWIKISTGKTIRIEVDSQATGLDIKKKILEKEGIPVETQHIFSYGIEWRNVWTNADMQAAVANNSKAGFTGIVHLALSLPAFEKFKPFVENYQSVIACAPELSVYIPVEVMDRYGVQSTEAERRWNTIGKSVKSAIIYNIVETRQKKYLLLDYGGVLDGEMIDENLVTPDDLVLCDVGGGFKQVLRHGVTIVNQLNELVTTHGYQIAFHSENKESQQLEVLEKLETACQHHNITFPKVAIMAVYDKDKYPDVLPHKSQRSFIRSYGNEDDEATCIAGYGIEKDGKSCVREAIDVASRNQLNVVQSIVFDDDPGVILQAQQEGYQTQYINDNHSLHNAVEEVLNQANAFQKVRSHIGILREYGRSLVNEAGQEAMEIADDLEQQLALYENQPIKGLYPFNMLQQYFHDNINQSDLNHARDDAFSHIIANILLGLTVIGFIAQCVNKYITGSFGFFFSRETTRKQYAEDINQSLMGIPLIP